MKFILKYAAAVQDGNMEVERKRAVQAQFCIGRLDVC